MQPQCPVCKRPVKSEREVNPNAPFCTARCKAVDLGRWLSGAYSLPVLDEAPSEADLAQVLAPGGDA